MAFLDTTKMKQIKYEEYEDIFGFDVTPTSELEVNTELYTERNTEVSPDITTEESLTEGLTPEAILPGDKVECSAKCEDEEYNPLCGDDGVTYSSLCHLQVTLITFIPAYDAATHRRATVGVTAGSRCFMRASVGSVTASWSGCATW